MSSINHLNQIIVLIIGLSVIIFLVIWMISPSESTGRYKSNSSTPLVNLSENFVFNVTNNHYMINNNGRAGLYVDSEFVQEIMTKSELEIFKRSHKYSIIVFYASWCGHCRSFAPKFIRITNGIAHRILELNQPIKHTVNKYPLVHFAAIDCANYFEICKENNVQFYPQMMAFGFDKSVSSNVPGMSIKHSKEEPYDKMMVTFLSTHIFTVSYFYLAFLFRILTNYI